MDISHQLAEISIRLAKDGFVTALKNVPCLSIFSVIVLAVAGQDPLHYPANRFGLPLDQKMKVVRHQAVSIEKETQLCLLDREQ